MKKNLMMRAASVLLVAVMLTTCAISGTFAKYVTAAEGSDTARVADWGVVATVTGNAFKTQYEKTDGAYDVTAYTVVSSEDPKDNILAPGTNGAFGGVSLTGSPEVAVKVDYEGTDVTITGWMINHDEDDGTTPEIFYCPVVFNVNGTPVNGLDYTSASALETALETAVTKGAGMYAPNTDLATIDALNGEYTWNWAFETGADAAAKAQNNKYDTMLGNNAAADPAVDANTIAFNVKVTVEQVD